MVYTCRVRLHLKCVVAKSTCAGRAPGAVILVGQPVLMSVYLALGAAANDGEKRAAWGRQRTRQAGACSASTHCPRRLLLSYPCRVHRRLFSVSFHRLRGFALLRAGQC